MTNDASLRLELFVDDCARSVDFYTRALAFAIERETPGYVSLRRGNAVLGIGLAAHLPPGHHFSRAAMAGQRGAGAEIVLEVGDVDADYARARDAGAAISSPLAARPWGPRDFRLVDPDGYYIRVTAP
jgi:lactoylglutathione lyase